MKSVTPLWRASGQLFLAVGRLEDCEQILDSLNQFETTPGLTPSFPVSV